MQAYREHGLVRDCTCWRHPSKMCHSCTSTVGRRHQRTSKNRSIITFSLIHLRGGEPDTCLSTSVLSLMTKFGSWTMSDDWFTQFHIFSAQSAYVWLPVYRANRAASWKN